MWQELGETEPSFVASTVSHLTQAWDVMIGLDFLTSRILWGWSYEKERKSRHSEQLIWASLKDNCLSEATCVCHTRELGCDAKPFSDESFSDKAAVLHRWMLQNFRAQSEPICDWKDGTCLFKIGHPALVINPLDHGLTVTYTTHTTHAQMLPRKYFYDTKCPGER